jgi:peptidyl-prolyl cis-trans isomerase C
MLKKSNQQSKSILFLVFLAAALVLGGCRSPRPVDLPSLDTPTPTQSSEIETEEPTLTPDLPTATPVPLAAVVNGEVITLEEYQLELARYKDARIEAGPEGEQRLLDEMIDQLLFVQAAREAGYQLTDGDLDQRIARLAAEVGGEQAFEEWLIRNGYSESGFREALAKSVAAAWQRDRIIETLPLTIAQVRARQILLYNGDQANQVLAQLQSGTDFARLAARYDPVTGGELGWFPQGYLPHKQIEEAAFSLQPGEISSVIETSVGYHLIQVVERQDERPLDDHVRLVLQSTLLEEWLEARRAQSDIHRMLP